MLTPVVRLVGSAGVFRRERNRSSDPSDPLRVDGCSRTWFEKVTDEATYKTGYTSKGDGGARLQEASHLSRLLQDDLKTAGIPKWGPGGKVDFHALRTAYVTFLLETDARVKEAQALARHSTPTLTMTPPR